MNAENLMHAIGGISDRYVAEFAEVRPVTPKRCRRHRLGALAACVCLALTAIVWVVYNAACLLYTSRSAHARAALRRYAPLCVPSARIVCRSVRFAGLFGPHRV